MTIEEHGGGRQLVRFRVWPRCSLGNLGVTLLFASLSGGAALDVAWAAGVILGVTALLLALIALEQSAGAMAAFLQGLGSTEKN
jgi:hypothetical protein